MPATAQINVRIDSQLKKDGDDALAKTGLSPTKAIRALWELTDRYRESPDPLIDALYPDQAKKRETDRVLKRERADALIDEGPTIVENALTEIGISQLRNTAWLSTDQLKDIDFQERFEKDVLHG